MRGGGGGGAWEGGGEVSWTNEVSVINGSRRETPPGGDLYS